MKDFGRWFADFALEKPKPEEKLLPEGIWEYADGKYKAECCRCKDYFEIDYIDQVPPEGIDHYCGGGPSCCP